MHFIDIFIKRPILSTVIALLFIVSGIGAALSLQLREYPLVNNATITVSTTYSGAVPSIIEGFITIPIEQSVATSEGIDYMYSYSTTGSSNIYIITALDADPDTVLSQVVQNVYAVLSQLPSDAQMPAITINSSNSFPSLILAFTSDSLNQQQMSAYLKNILTPQLLALGGLSEVDIMGEQDYSMRVYMDQSKLMQFGMTPTELATVLGENSTITAGGILKSSFSDYTINALTNLTSQDDYEKMVVKTTDSGAIVRLKDVAKAKLGAESYDTSSTFNGKTAVNVGAVLSSDANALTVVKNILDHLPEIRKNLPPGLDVEVAYNNSSYIEASIDDVISALIEATIIVGIVLFLFIGSLRSVIIPSIAIPISLIGAFFCMLIMGFTINLLTLLAMVLAIGLVVDDAIVVLENIYRHVEEGSTPFDAAIKGAREIANPIILMTLTLVAVYIPIGMMGGFTGILFTEFAYTLASAVVISGIVAYSFSPMLCSKILNNNMPQYKMVKIVDSIFEKVKNAYTKALTAVMGVRYLVLIFGLVILFSCYTMFDGTKSELTPTEDQSFIGMQGTAPSNANLDYLETFVPAFYKATESVPGKKAAFVVSGNPQSNNFFGGFVMKNWSERDITQMQATPILQSNLNDITGAQVYTFTQPSLPGIPYGPPMQFVIQSPTDSHKTIYPYANKIVEKMLTSGLFMFAQSDLMFDNPQINISIDRDKASSLGIKMSDIQNALQYSYSGNYVNYFDFYGYSYEVIPKIQRDLRMTVEQLGNIYIKAHPSLANIADADGDGDDFMVPLSSLVSFKTEGVPLSLNRFQQMNSATISAVMASGVTQGQAIAYLNDLANEILPKSMSYDYQGSARSFVENGNTMMVAFIFAIIVIFLMLSAQFESFRDPLIILVTVPMAICGALIPLYFGQLVNAGWASLNIYSELGLVTLIGLISKHGILMVEFANKLQEKGHSKYEAIIESASLRLRPILMTTAAMVFGVLPLVYASGAGAVSRNSIGIVIASGMTIGTCFTLFVLPCIYMFLAGDRRKIVDKWKKDEVAIARINRETKS